MSACVYSEKKELAQLSLTDLVFVLLISNSVQNSMVGPDDTLQGGMLAALTLFIVNRILKFLLYKSDKIRKFMEGEPVILIRHGKVNHKEMRKNRISLKELEEVCRQNGEGDLANVDLAILEVDGQVSVLKDESIKKGGKFDINSEEFKEMSS